jgi:hypothetical protein
MSSPSTRDTDAYGIPERAIDPDQGDERLTTVRIEMKFLHDGAVFEVESISECSARCRSRATREVTVEDRTTGERRTFTANSRRTVHLAPNAVVEEVEGGRRDGE